MKITKYICDRCGKEIYILHKIEIYRDDSQNWLVTMDNDFCEKCAEEMANFALSKQSTEKQDDETEEENTNDSKKSITELLEEGKTTEEIIKIKGCKKDSVYRARYMQKKKQEEEKIIKADGNEKWLDIGKINALRKANWDVHKIADEMGVEDREIADVLGVAWKIN